MTTFRYGEVSQSHVTSVIALVHHGLNDVVGRRNSVYVGANNRGVEGVEYSIV